jgi:hypothetical protein
MEVIEDPAEDPQDIGLLSRDQDFQDDLSHHRLRKSSTLSYTAGEAGILPNFSRTIGACYESHPKLMRLAVVS